MNPVDVRCPRCGAEPGQKCKDSRGKGTDPHGARKKFADPQAEHWRQAKLKTEREREKAVAEAPLFAEQVVKEVRGVEDNYWRTRLMVAGIKEDGAPYAGFFKDWNVRLLSNLARRVMSPEMFAWLDARRWKGDEEWFWTDVLTGRKRIVARWERISHGWVPVYFPPNEYRAEESMHYIEKVELREAAVWPPEGWRPPFTAEQVKAFLHVPPPADHDDGGLAERVDALLGLAR